MHHRYRYSPSLCNTHTCLMGPPCPRINRTPRRVSSRVALSYVSRPAGGNIMASSGSMGFQSVTKDLFIIIYFLCTLFSFSLCYSFLLNMYLAETVQTNPHFCSHFNVKYKEIKIQLIILTHIHIYIKWKVPGQVNIITTTINKIKATFINK